MSRLFPSMELGRDGQFAGGKCVRLSHRSFGAAENVIHELRAIRAEEIDTKTPSTRNSRISGQPAGNATRAQARRKWVFYCCQSLGIRLIVHGNEGTIETFKSRRHLTIADRKRRRDEKVPGE